MIRDMTAPGDFTGLGLQSLEPEPWGRRLARARHNAGYTLRDVEDLLAPIISRAGLARLEDRETVPTRRQDRARAIVVLLLYRHDPTDFDLGYQDVPPATDLRALTRLRIRGSGWLLASACHLRWAA